MPGDGSIALNIIAQADGASLLGNWAGTFSMAGHVMVKQSQPLTAGVWLPMFSSMANPQLIVIVSLELFLSDADPTNYIQVALDDTGTTKIAKIYPGMPMVFCPHTSPQVYWLKPINKDTLIETAQPQF